MTNTTIAGHHPFKTNSVLRVTAHILSYIFHPLFISAYVVGFLIFFHPYAFAGFDMRTKVFRFIGIVFCNTFLPLFAVALMKALGLINSIMLRTVKDRIIPYIVVMTFYFWSWWVFKNLPNMPALSINFLLGAFLAVCAGFFCNIFFKISMHAIAMGGALMFFFLFGFHDAFGSGLYIAIALLCTGLVCTSRLLLGAHTAFDVWMGLFIGILTQWVAWQF